MELSRWTPLTFLAPSRYVDTETAWSDVDFAAWSRRTYEWTEDPWNGFRDFAQRPAETLSSGVGDCEDYALVAASWAVSQGRSGVGIAFCWESPYPWPRHVVAFDEERVYSSGTISTQSVDEWVEDSQYAFSISRRIP